MSIRHGGPRPRRWAGGGIRDVINNVGRRFVYNTYVSRTIVGQNFNIQLRESVARSLGDSGATLHLILSIQLFWIWVCRHHHHVLNKVSPLRDVTVLARHAVSTTTTTYASEQNNTGPLGGPVISQKHQPTLFDRYHNWRYCSYTFVVAFLRAGGGHEDEGVWLLKFGLAPGAPPLFIY